MRHVPAWRSYRRQIFTLQPPNKDFWGSRLSAGFDIGDRGASGLDRWYLSSGLKLKLCSHSHTPRTNLVAEAEVCESKEIRGPLLRSKKTSLYKGRKPPPWWLKREGAPSHNKGGHGTIGLCSGVCLSKNLHTHLGEGLWISHMWRRKQDNWSNVNKDPEGLTYKTDVNHLVTVLLLTQDVHTPSRVCVSA